ncbi:GGDEF domain-containing protein [Xanthobacter dioxanivorans]|nr:GGDEF domain-containing protein [Xanthobacter dioxanivorans]
MNVAVAALFAVSYLSISIVYPQHKAFLWFAASFGAAMLTPIAQLAQAYTGWTLLFGPVIYLAFATCLLLMVPALASFYRRPIPWRTVAVLAGATLFSGLLVQLVERGTPVYVVLYLLPFMLSTAICVLVVLRDSPRQPRDLLIAGMFGLLFLHLPLKAVLALREHTGPHQPNYMDSAFAVVSQIGTGTLMVATGLLLLINAILAVIGETRAEAETDLLSGVLNRRGFEARAARVLSQDRRAGWMAALLLIDIDHFKRVNDTYGHAAGDRAIRWFAQLLEHTMPQSAVIGRLGGEEFAVLLDRTTRETAWLQAEAIRQATVSHGEGEVASMTVSIGVADVRAGEVLHAAQERADAALYAAKRAGRNQVCLAPEEAGNVVPLRRAGDY